MMRDAHLWHEIPLSISFLSAGYNVKLLVTPATTFAKFSYIFEVPLHAHSDAEVYSTLIRTSKLRASRLGYTPGAPLEKACLNVAPWLQWEDVKLHVTLTSMDVPVRERVRVSVQSGTEMFPSISQFAAMARARSAFVAAQTADDKVRDDAVKQLKVKQQAIIEAAANVPATMPISICALVCVDALLASESKFRDRMMTNKWVVGDDVFLCEEGNEVKKLFQFGRLVPSKADAVIVHVCENIAELMLAVSAKLKSRKLPPAKLPVTASRLIRHVRTIMHPNTPSRHNQSTIPAADVAFLTTSVDDLHEMHCGVEELRLLQRA